MFTIQVEYGMGEYPIVETCEGFATMSEAYSFATQLLVEVANVIHSGVTADNAIIRVWRENTTGKLISSCVNGCR